MPSCLLTEVYHLNSWSFKADITVKTLCFFLLLTYSRIDSIRTSQSLNCLILFCMSFKYFKRLFFLPHSEMIELSFILNIWTFLLMSMVYQLLKIIHFIILTQYIHCSQLLVEIEFVTTVMQYFKWYSLILILLEFKCGRTLLHLQTNDFKKY